MQGEEDEYMFLTIEQMVLIVLSAYFSIFSQPELTDADMTIILMDAIAVCNDESDTQEGLLACVEEEIDDRFILDLEIVE